MRKHVFAVVIAMAFLTPALAEETKFSGPTMAIKGVGEYSVKSDYATFSLTLETRNADAAKAMTAHADKVAKVAAILDGLKSEGIVIEKASFSSQVEQKMQRSASGLPSQGINKPVGPPEHVAKTVYSLKTRKIDTAALTKIAGMLASGDLYDLSSLHFFSDNPRKASLEARKNAVQDAREQAEVYAGAANIKLIEVAEITDSDASEYRNGGPDGYADLPRRQAQPGKWLKVSEIIPPETLLFTAGVNIMWRIGPKD